MQKLFRKETKALKVEVKAQYKKAQVSTYAIRALVYRATISESPRPGREHPGLSSRCIKLPVFDSEIQSECFNMLFKEVSQIYNYEVNI